MNHDTTLPFSFPAVCKKKISAAFDGGRISSDSGVMLLAQAERKLVIADQLAAAIADRRALRSADAPISTAFRHHCRDERGG